MSVVCSVVMPNGVTGNSLAPVWRDYTCDEAIAECVGESLEIAKGIGVTPDNHSSFVVLLTFKNE